MYKCVRGIDFYDGLIGFVNSSDGVYVCLFFIVHPFCDFASMCNKNLDLFNVVCKTYFWNTFIMYVHSQKIGKSNNLKNFGARKICFPMTLM